MADAMMLAFNNMNATVNMMNGQESAPAQGASSTDSSEFQSIMAGLLPAENSGSLAAASTSPSTDVMMALLPDQDAQNAETAPVPDSKSDTKVDDLTQSVAGTLSASVMMAMLYPQQTVDQTSIQPSGNQAAQGVEGVSAKQSSPAGEQGTVNAAIGSSVTTDAGSVVMPQPTTFDKLLDSTQTSDVKDNIPVSDKIANETVANVPDKAVVNGSANGAKLSDVNQVDITSLLNAAKDPLTPSKTDVSANQQTSSAIDSQLLSASQEKNAAKDADATKVMSTQPNAADPLTAVAVGVQSPGEGNSNQVKPGVSAADSTASVVTEIKSSDANIPVQQTESKRKDTSTGGDSQNHNIPFQIANDGVKADKVDVSQSTAGAASVTASPSQPIGGKIISQIVKSVKTNILDNGMGMTIRLDPPHLGTVKMDVIAQDGLVTAHLQTVSAEVKNVLETDLTSLKRSLAEAGVHVDSINVSVGDSSTNTGDPRRGLDQRQANGNFQGFGGIYPGAPAIDPVIAASAQNRLGSSGLNYLA